MDLPSFGSLQILEALSRHRRIGVAAHELGVSHAAVSQTVSRLETRYGVQLFTRSSWGVEATPSCQGLIKAYLSASSALRRALVEASEGGRCHALIPLTVWRWLSLATSRLRGAFPDVSIHTYQDEGAVDLTRADFAILSGGHLPVAGFEATALYDERLIPVCSPRFAEAVRISTPSGLARADLLIERPDLWLRWFSHAGLVAEPSLTGPIIADPSLVLEAALQGQGVGLCCSVAASAALCRGDLVAPIDVSVGSGRRWWALWRQGSARDKTAMGVLEWCLAELHSIKTAHVSLVDETGWSGNAGPPGLPRSSASRRAVKLVGERAVSEVAGQVGEVGVRRMDAAE